MKYAADPARDESSFPVVSVIREVGCEVGFVPARVRLLQLIHRGFLYAACTLAGETAIGAGQVRALRPLKPPVVSIGEPESGSGMVTVPLRWAADCGPGRLGLLLDAELAFIAMIGSTTARFDGVFRFPAAPYAGRLADALTRTRAAESAAELLLTRVRGALIRGAEAETPVISGLSGRVSARTAEGAIEGKH